MEEHRQNFSASVLEKLGFSAIATQRVGIRIPLTPRWIIGE